LKYTQTTPEDIAEPVPEEPEQPEVPTSFSASPRFAICCNSCHQQTSNVHYHCSTCEDGDFDLCMTCVDSGVTCYSTDHWLIKRTMAGGVIVSSTTEKIAPKPKPKQEEPKTSTVSDSLMAQLNALDAPPLPTSFHLSEPSALNEGTNWAQLEEKFANLNVAHNTMNYFAEGIRTCNGCIRGE
jgi:next to BRCA1 gene 1 protein